MLVHNFFDFHVERNPESPCIIFDGVTLSFSDVNIEVGKIVSGLTRLGIKRGDRIACLNENCADYVFSMIAASKLSCVLIPLNYRLSTPELLFIIEDSHAKVLLVPDITMQESVAELENNSSSLPIVITKFSSGDKNTTRLDWTETFSSINTMLEEGVNREESDPFLQLYTSGTTGNPKGVLLSHKNLVSATIASLLAVVNRPGPGTLDLVCAPNFHIGGTGSMLIPILAGGGIVLHSAFDPQGVVDDLQKYPITTIFMVPAMILAVINSVPDINKLSFPNLDKISYGASPINSTLLKQAISIFECDFYQLYGMTESTGTVVSLSADDHIRAVNGDEYLLSSCGRAQIGCEIKIINKEGETLPVNEIGEIMIKGDNVMIGYHGLPGETEKNIVDGWLHSGDSGLLDEEGYLFIKDRIKDMVVSGAENIYPVEIENVLSSHPSIADISIIGVPDDKFGEALLACIVLKPNQTLKVEDLIEFSRGKLAGYKIPRQVKILDDLPRNPSGKVLKKELRKPYWEHQNRGIG